MTTTVLDPPPARGSAAERTDVGCASRSKATALVVGSASSVVRAGLDHCLGSSAGIRVMATTATALEVSCQVQRHQADIALLDCALAEEVFEGGLLPDDGTGPDVIVWGGADTPVQLWRSLRAGVRGHLVSDCELGILEDCIRSVAAGQEYVDPRVVTSHLRLREGDWPYGLTEQETRIAVLLSDGLTNRQIASRLGVGDETVKTHLSNLRAKLSAADRAHAAAIAIRAGLHTLRPYVLPR